MSIIAYIIVIILAVKAFDRVYTSFRDLRRHRKTTKICIAILIMYAFILAVYDRQLIYDEELYKDHKHSNETSTDPSIDAKDLYRQAKYCESMYASSQRNQCFERLLIDIKENSDLPEQAYRHCGLDGNWLDRSNKSSLIGWTDFIKCFPTYMQDLLENVSESSDGFSAKIKVAVWVRGIELFGLTTSTVALIMALIIFTFNPKLLNDRTRIHRHLFTSLLGRTLTMLFIYIDQEIFEILPHHNLACIIVYSLLEVLTSISFSFMFIEGINLYRTISPKALRQGYSYSVIIASGYICPIINTVTWFTTASFKYGWDNHTCWFGYNMDPLYFLLQIPRLFVIFFNTLFMGCIVNAVLRKLKGDVMNEVNRLKKALRAIAILMPLLGITNVISMLSPPLRDTTELFAVWAFVAFFLRSIQGFLLSYIYCFRNNEVLEVLCGRPNSNILGVNDLAVHFRAYHSKCQIIRREDEARVNIPEADPPMDEELEDVPLNDNNSVEAEAGAPSIVTEVTVHQDPEGDQ